MIFSTNPKITCINRCENEIILKVKWQPLTELESNTKTRSVFQGYKIPELQNPAIILQLLRDHPSMLPSVPCASHQFYVPAAERNSSLTHKNTVTHTKVEIYSFNNMT